MSKESKEHSDKDWQCTYVSQVLLNSLTQQDRHHTAHFIKAIYTSATPPQAPEQYASPNHDLQSLPLSHHHHTQLVTMAKLTQLVMMATVKTTTVTKQQVTWIDKRSQKRKGREGRGRKVRGGEGKEGKGGEERGGEGTRGEGREGRRREGCGVEGR